MRQGTLACILYASSERIVLMVVALRTLRCRAQPHIASRGSAIGLRDPVLLLGTGATFGIQHRTAHAARGDFRIQVLINAICRGVSCARGAGGMRLMALES